MEVVENQVVTGKTITIDEKHFVNCRYSSCVVIYGGGEFGWVNTTFENCQITLSGPAQKTAAFLGFFGLVPPSGGKLPPGGQFGFPKKPDGSVQ